ncbi:hypothetical protein OF83DRAFT_750555 [Amylostereum chailletii]|nr:hypothetical protein OF83DRAFT_750555 [Amylostereum chailletii]
MEGRESGSGRTAWKLCGGLELRYSSCRFGGAHLTQLHQTGQGLSESAQTRSGIRCFRRIPALHMPHDNEQIFIRDRVRMRRRLLSSNRTRSQRTRSASSSHGKAEFSDETMRVPKPPTSLSMCFPAAHGMRSEEASSRSQRNRTSVPDTGQISYSIVTSMPWSWLVTVCAVGIVENYRSQVATRSGNVCGGDAERPSCKANTPALIYPRLRIYDVLVLKSLQSRHCR